MPEDIPLMTFSSHEGPEHRPNHTTSRSRIVTPALPLLKTYSFASNTISNAKYNAATFMPKILYEQFKFFFNLYFLLVALSQAWPLLRIGYLSSYIVPLAFVLSVTMGKEAWDDLLRRRRDREANSELFEVARLGHRSSSAHRSSQRSSGAHESLLQDDNDDLLRAGERAGDLIPSKNLQVGDIVILYTNQRVPADVVILKTSEPSGETFIRTDQLDGETDWKLRTAPALTQAAHAHVASQVSDQGAQVYADGELEVRCAAPTKSISQFQGTLRFDGAEAPLTVDNTMWANTVVAAGSVEGIVVYTGRDTRMALNTSASRSKVPLLELEVNSVSKILCACVLVLSVVLVAIRGFSGQWYLQILRFLILFSTIIPVSLRVNLDMAKSVYAYQIEHDPSIPETVVRTSTIPEDLGRIDYLLTDKTGTITQNNMDLRKIHVGSVAFGADSMDEVIQYVAHPPQGVLTTNVPGSGSGRNTREVAGKVWNLAHCLALCHSVTPTEDFDAQGQATVAYQAVSPDEIAIVSWTAQVGLELARRDRKTMTIKHTASGELLTYELLYTFPFNSDSKRMGIVVKRHDVIWYFIKGADTAVGPLVQANDWLDEEVGNMAREGLRTLVVARKSLTQLELEGFAKAYAQASLLMTCDRDSKMAGVVKRYLEHDLDLLGITGVEDKLQPDIKPSLETLRNAGIKIWMLTGDKVETARCVAVSSRLVSRGQPIYSVTGLASEYAARQHLDYLASMGESCLLVDGASLQFLMREMPREFSRVALRLSVVVACRCTPQQKADLTNMVKAETGKRVAAIGDGGNDVSMIQAADIGLGIVGKEGRQASLAADFSVTLFCHTTKLLLWHGRNSYKRSAKLAQVVIHRGLVVSVCQAVFSICSKFEPIALYRGWLVVGYATLYTMAPVFSLVTDQDVDQHLAKMYPELYDELKDGHSLSYRSFFAWAFVALYQGIIVEGMSQLLLGKNALKKEMFTTLVLTSYSALVFTELLMVAIEITTWNWIMVVCEVVTALSYIVSVPLLPEYFNLEKLKSPMFHVTVAAILVAAILPAWIGKLINGRLKPPSYAKVQV